MSIQSPLRLLVLGASYGLLPAMRASLAGHEITVVGRRGELDAMASTELAVVVQAREGGDLILRSDRIRLQTPEGVDASAFDLVLLAMQEPQFQSPAIASLMQRLMAARLPCLSLMNMPPLPYLARLPAVDLADVRGAYSSLSVWDACDPDLFTLASPDPQALRLDPAKPGELTVTLPSNFKCAPFADALYQQLLQRLADDIDAWRHVDLGISLTPRVRVVPHRSLFVPLAKWPMLITGNYRCVQDEGEPMAICDAVGRDPRRSRELYDWVQGIVRRLGASDADLVPFDRYAVAAASLTNPSSVARALQAGATAVERVDRLVQSIAATQGQSHPALDEIVARVDRLLRRAPRRPPPQPFSSASHPPD